MSKSKKIRNIIFIALMVLINAFIIFEASLPGGLSSIHSGIFSDVMGGIINDNVEVKQDVVDVDSIELTCPYGNNVIMGNTTRLDCKILPENASNKAVTYVSEPEGIVNVVNNGLVCYVEALSEPNQSVTVKAISSNNKVSEFVLNIIAKQKPVDFNVESQFSLPLYTSKAIDLDFSKENDAIANFKALIKTNPDLLNITSDNEGIVKISHGFIKAVGVGETFINIENYPSKVKVIVTPSDITPILPDDDFTLSLKKDNIYNKDTDYIKEHYDELGSEIIVKTNENATDKNFAFKSLTPLTCLVNKAGRVFGTKMAGKGKIEATSIATGKSKILEFDVKDVLPTAMEINVHGRQDLAIGQSFSVSGNFTGPFNFSNTDIIVTTDNSEVASIGPMGRLVRVTALAEGKATITVKSVANPSLVKSINVTFTKKTAINDENKNAFESMVRKLIGHFSLFFVDGIFTTLMFVFVLEDKKWYKRHRMGLISLGTGFGVAWLSEFIQIFVKRGASISDVMLDFTGFLIATVIITLIFVIIDAVKKHKERKNENEEI